MNKRLSPERFFSLSCFEALRLIRIYSQNYPTLSMSEIVDLIKNVEADAINLDMEAAASLHSIIPASCPLNGQAFYQFCIKVVIINYQPIWAKSMRQGRIRFVDSLREDYRDVFTASGLLQTPPSIAVVSWWDDIVGHSRLVIDSKKMEQARKAEELTIKREQKRLMNLKIQKQPEWTGLDDNFAGYDVLSYDIQNGYEIKKMIEVKSSIASPLRFYLSRNEWNTANRVGNAYVFHVWNMSVDPPVLHELTVEQIRPHIPIDNQRGKWSIAEIPITR